MAEPSKILIEVDSDGQIKIFDATLFGIRSEDVSPGSLLITGENMEVEIIR